MTSTDRSGRRALPPAVAWALEVMAWTLAAWGVWLVSLTAISAEDLGVGGGCAVLCGLTAAAVRRLVQGHGRPTWWTARPAVLLPVVIAAEAVMVLAAPWRPSHRRSRSGGGRLQRLAITTGDTPVARARRSFAVVVVSASPGSVVLEADPDTGDFVVHTFGSAGPTLPSRFARR